MTIDITREPPTDIFRNRSRYRLFTFVSLGLSVCGLLLAAYAILSTASHSELLETVAFSLFVGPALAFGYFGEKLRAYKRLTPMEEKELADMNLKHAEIKVYCDLVAKAGRQPTSAEFESCQAWAKDAELQARRK
jgi:hypothetical protein